MEFEFDVKKAIRQVTKTVAKLEKRHIPFAARVAANVTVYKVKKRMDSEIGKVLDSPTWRTKTATRYKKATKSEPSAKVYLDDKTQKGTPPYKYLGPQVRGGRRGVKAFERHLRRKKLMPGNKYAVPAKGAKLNKYGNITGGRHTKILSALRAGEKTQHRAGGKKTKFFSVRNHPTMPPGIYERYGRKQSQVRGVFMFVKKPTYKARLDFYGIAEKYAAHHFPREFAKAFREAVRTAR